MPLFKNTSAAEAEWWILKWGTPTLLIILVLLLWPREKVFSHTFEERTPGHLKGLEVAYQGYVMLENKKPDLSQGFLPLYEASVLCNSTHKKNADGFALDYWGRPYIFAGITDGKGRFYSVGANGIDEKGDPDSDDIVSWLPRRKRYPWFLKFMEPELSFYPRDTDGFP